MHASVPSPATFFFRPFCRFPFSHLLYLLFFHFLCSFTKKKKKTKLYVLELRQLFYGHLAIQSKKLPNDDSVDDDGLGESGSATERWLPFEVGKWVVFASGVNVVDSEIKNIIVSGAKNMGSRKSETTLEQPSAMRSSEVNLQSTASWMYNITGCSD